jgi:inosine/xanthosine triphosphatase
MGHSAVIGSRNPAKIAAVRDAFALVGGVVDIISTTVHGGFRQPLTDNETRLGAEQRAKRARERYPEADWWIGIEGGIEDVAGDLMVIAWAVVERGDQIGRSRSASFALPAWIAARIRAGATLGAITELVSEGSDWQSTGLVATLSSGRINRTQLYVQPVLLALLPFLSPWHRVLASEGVSP